MEGPSSLVAHSRGSRIVGCRIVGVACTVILRAVVLIPFLVLAFPNDSPAQVRGFRLPVDIGQGPLLEDDVTRYRFEITAHPSVEIDRWRVGALVGIDFANPEWDVAFGARASYMVVPLSGFLDDVGLRIAIEYQHTTDSRDLFGGGLILDPDGLFRVGVWGGYDWGADGAWLKLTIGIDLTIFGSNDDDEPFQ